jgi:hypothetical protein
VLVSTSLVVPFTSEEADATSAADVYVEDYTVSVYAFDERDGYSYGVAMDVPGGYLSLSRSAARALAAALLAEVDEIDMRAARRANAERERDA